MTQSVLAAGDPAEPASSPPGSGENGTSVSGYHSVKGFGGPSSVGSQTRADSVRKKTPWHLQGFSAAMQPYYDFKDRVHKNHGLAFGADYNFLYQAASESMGEDAAAGGVVRLFGTWSLVGRESGNTGSLVAKIENRHGFGSGIVPQSLASEIGYTGLTAVVFSDAGTLLTNFYWNQSLYSDRLAFVAGIVDTTDYFDIHGLINPWTNYNNLSFSTDPTIPAPNQGLGAAVRVNIADHYYVLAGFADTNGDPSDTAESFDTFFSDREYIKHIEMGWIGSRQTEFSDNVHLFAWQADERTAAQVARGWGATVSYSQKFNDTWLPYARVGYSDGGGGVFLDRSLSAGLGYFFTGRSDLIGFGAAWGRPSEKTFGAELDEQYTLELFYRLQLFQHMTITPDIQWIIDPAQNPDEDQIWVIGLRTRLSF